MNIDNEELKFKGCNAKRVSSPGGRERHGTLVITKLSKFGVVMVADTAITIDDRPFVGCQKLFPVPQINAGISIWGNLNIRGTDADEVIRHFINNDVPEKMSLWDMANKLKEKLNNTFGNRLINENRRKMEEMGIHGACRMGMHVAGFDSKNGIRGPALYAINNGDYKIMMTERGFLEVSIDSTVEHYIENPPLRNFEIDPIYPRIYEGNHQDGRKNGDFAIYDYLSEKLSSIFSDLQQYNFIFPYPPSLETIGEYLRFWVNFIKDVYRLSSENERIYGRLPPMIDYMHIGDPVTVLTISEKGIDSFYTI